MIDWSKRYICENCEILSGQKNPVRTYTFTLGRSGKSFILCENCVKELSDTVKEIMNKEEIE